MYEILLTFYSPECGTGPYEASALFVYFQNAQKQGSLMQTSSREEKQLHTHTGKVSLGQISEGAV